MPCTETVKINQRYTAVFRITEQRNIVHSGKGIREDLQGLQSTRALDSSVRVALVDSQQELTFTPVSLVQVEGIIATESDYNIFTIHCASKKFHAIIFIGNDLHMVNNGLSSHSAQCKTVDLVTFADIGTTMPDRYIPQDS